MRATQAETVARMYALTGQAAEPLGPSAELTMLYPQHASLRALRDRSPAATILVDPGEAGQGFG